VSSSVSIGEIARRMGLRPSAIRFYESERLLEEIPRRSGRRVYDESVCERLALIQTARRAGFTIAEIRHLFHGFPADASAPDRWRGLVERKRAEIRDKMRELTRMTEILDLLEGCDCPDLEVCGAAAASLTSRPSEPTPESPWQKTTQS